MPGDSPLEQTIAALEMLAIVHNVPFRRDIIERAGKNSLKKGNISLELVGSLSTFMGFVGNISDIPLRQLTRLPFPCFTIYDTNIVMIHDITRDSVKAVLPAYGRIELSISDLLGNQPGLRVLTLSPGRDSQQKKLGFSWFVPQLKKYRKSLIEVLAASLVLQLLNLAQPLVMQQIFDRVIVQQNIDTLYTLGLVLLGVSLFQGLIVQFVHIFLLILPTGLILP